MRLFAKQRLNGKPLLRENEPQPLAYSYHGIFLGNGMKVSLTPSPPCAISEISSL